MKVIKASRVDFKEPYRFEVETVGILLKREDEDMVHLGRGASLPKDCSIKSSIDYLLR